jgi:hypothetical protein
MLTVFLSKGAGAPSMPAERALVAKIAADITAVAAVLSILNTVSISLNED